MYVGAILYTLYIFRGWGLWYVLYFLCELCWRCVHMDCSTLICLHREDSVQYISTIHVQHCATIEAVVIVSSAFISFYNLSFVFIMYVLYDLHCILCTLNRALRTLCSPLFTFIVGCVQCLVCFVLNCAYCGIFILYRILNNAVYSVSLYVHVFLCFMCGIV
jgi:hypothetical protein